MQQFTNNRKEIRISTIPPQQTPDIYKFQKNVTNKKSWDGHKSIRDMKMFLLILSQLVWAEEANNDNINYNALRWRDYWVLCRILYKPPLPLLKGRMICTYNFCLTSMFGWLVAWSTLVSDTVLAMMFLQILSTLLNFLPSTGICFIMSSLLNIGSRYSQLSWHLN